MWWTDMWDNILYSYVIKQCVPFVGAIPGGLYCGSMIRIHGQMLHCGGFEKIYNWFSTKWEKFNNFADLQWILVIVQRTPFVATQFYIWVCDLMSMWLFEIIWHFMHGAWKNDMDGVPSTMDSHLKFWY